jgi:hypothetical protein
LPPSALALHRLPFPVIVPMIHADVPRRARTPIAKFIDAEHPRPDAAQIQVRVDFPDELVDVCSVEQEVGHLLDTWTRERTHQSELLSEPLNGNRPLDQRITGDYQIGEIEGR